MTQPPSASSSSKQATAPGFLSRALGIILLFGTVGLTSCQSMLTTFWGGVASVTRSWWGGF